MLAAATAAVVIMAITVTGVPVNHVSANDGGVWVVNDSYPGEVGEFNVPIKQLSVLVPAAATAVTNIDLDVYQQGTTVLAVDRGMRKVFPIDVATGAANPAGGIGYGPGGQIALGGGVAALVEPLGHTAGVWAQATSGQDPSITGIDPLATKPLGKLPGAVAVAVDSDGDVFAASATALMEIPAVRGAFGSPRTFNYPNGTITPTAVALTTVGTTPVVMDTSATKPVLIFPESGRSTTIPPENGPSFALQQPGTESGSVLVASASHLYAVPLSGGTRTTLASTPDSGGVPADPVDLAGCAFGAWSGSPGIRAEACPGSPPSVRPLLDLHNRQIVSDHLVYRVNNGQILLNDDANGAAWTVTGAPAQVLRNDEWQRVLQGLTAKASNHSTNRADISRTPHRTPPQLRNPTLYARAGLASTLHVLDDDTDPGGSILSIVSVTPSGPGFTASVSADNQSVVLDLSPTATSQINLEYEVVDGFGLTKSGPVAVVPAQGNKPPTPPPTPMPLRHVVSGGTVSLQVLGGWRDPENDALTVSEASVPSGDGTIGWTSDGLLTYTAPSLATDKPISVTYEVTDGRSPPVSQQFAIEVLGRGDLQAYPPTAVPDAVTATVGRASTFDPLANDVFGADPIHPGATLSLAGPVSGAAGLSVATNASTGQLTLTPSVAGTYSLEYQAAYGSGTSPPTQILVEAVPPPSLAPPPVTTPVSVLLHGQYPATVDVLASDYDPSGGLLSVVGVTAPPGVQATIEDGQYLRIAATTSTPAPAMVVTYNVSNGQSTPVSGDVVVYWQPPIEPPTPPDVPATYATVRAGDEIDVPVLATASDPDGESVHLLAGGTPNAVSLSQTNPGTAYPTSLGAASLAGGYIRYAAPAQGTLPRSVTAPEAVTLSYVVESETGARTTGQVFVTINPDLPSLNAAPAPAEVDARTQSGATITIPIPTTGVAPNGDSATVTGITQSPHLGRVMGFNANSITYQAYPVSVGSGSFAGGTDSLSYSIEGPSGLTAQGVVRVGVTQPTQVQPPVAVDHYVTAAPGQLVDVDLITGDIVAAGDQLTVEPLKSYNNSLPGGAVLTGPGDATLQVAAPVGIKPWDIAYALSDGTASPSVAHVIVRSQPGFDLPPFASDYYPTPPAAGSQTVKVDVLAKDSDPGGSARDLTVIPFPGATVDSRSPSSLDITVLTTPRAVPYEVRSARTHAIAVGVIHLPGASVGPQLKAGQVIDVPAGGTKVVSIGDYITDSVHSIRLTTNEAQQASPSGGLSVKVDDNTHVTLTGGPSYNGPGSLTLQVIDAPNLSAPGAHVVTFTIPVQVGARSPIIRCPSVPLQVVESGDPVDANIAGICEVWTPSGASPNTLTYTERWAQSVSGVSLGWAPHQAGHIVRVTAASSAVGGAVGRVAVCAVGSLPSGCSSLQVQAIEAGPATISAINVPGILTESNTTVDVTHYVNSPLKSPSIVIISVGPPSKGRAQVSSPVGARVTINVARGVNGTVSFPIVVSDQGRNRADRYIHGAINLQVLDNPGAPTGLAGVPGDRLVKLSWNAAPDDGSPIEYYTITEGGVSAQTPGTSYTWSRGLQNGSTYLFTVTAHNRKGAGPSVSESFEPNSIPDAPTNVTAKGFDSYATVAWTAPFNGGKQIDRYIVSITPAVGGPSTETVLAPQTSYKWTGLKNTVGPYTFTVVAHNVNGVGPASPRSNPVYAHGVPATPPAPTASGKVSTDQTTTTVTVTWPAIPNCNDAQPCASYLVTELNSGTGAGTETVTSGQCTSSNCTAIFGPLTDNGDGYTYTVSATNHEGDVSAASSQSSPVVYAVGYPSQITDLSVSPGNTAVNATFTLPPSHGSSISRVDYYLNGSSTPNGSWSNPGASGQKVTEQISSLTNGTTYSVQVSACSQSAGGTSGGCGPLSNSSSAVPYGPPYPPNVSAAQSGNSIVYSWSGGGNNGRPVQTYHVCFDSSCSDYGSGGSTSVGYACGTSHTITAYVVDSVGQQSSTASASASTAGCVTPAISASQGASGYSSIGTCQQGNTVCHWLAFQVQNFPTGTFSWQCISNGSVSYDSSAYGYTIRITSANESFSGGSGGNGYCIFGTGVTEAIRIDNVTSNGVPHS